MLTYSRLMLNMKNISNIIPISTILEIKRRFMKINLLTRSKEKQIPNLQIFLAAIPEALANIKQSSENTR